MQLGPSRSLLSPMAQDNSTVSRLRSIAETLEERAGITPPDALARDASVESQLRRIEDAIPDALDAIDTDISTGNISFCINDPDGMATHAGRATKSQPIWFNGTGRPFQISRIRAVADMDDYVFVLFKSASDVDLSTATDVQLASVTCSTDGTSAYVADITAFDDDTIDDGCWLIWEHSSGSADVLAVRIEGQLQ